MLRKLLKYEFIAYSRIFLPMYAILMSLAILNRLMGMGSDFLGFSKEIVGAIGIMIYSIAIVGVVVITFIICIQRYYKSLYTDEGYLMHTLPVKKWKLIMSALIAATAWSMFSFIVILTSVLVQVLTPDLMNEFAMYVWPGIKLAFAMEGLNIAIIIVEVAALLLISTIGGFLFIYMSISIANVFNKNQVLASFLVYFAITSLLQIVSFIVSINTIPDIGKYVENLRGSELMLFFQLFFLILTVINAALSAILFFITGFFMKRKLNLN